MEILEAKNLNRIAEERLSQSLMVNESSQYQADERSIICECEHCPAKTKPLTTANNPLGEEAKCSNFNHPLEDTGRIQASARTRRKSFRCETAHRKSYKMTLTDKFRRQALLSPPRMSPSLLACLITLPALLQVAIGPLPVAEAWNLFDGPQASDGAKLSNASHQSIHSMAASTLLNAAATSTTAHETDSSRMRPSPLGKILQAAEQTASGNGSSGGSEPARSASSIALQLLKPRKSVSQDGKSASSKQQAAALEQQIINQHSRAHHHLSGGSHQRLLPTKHRDQKLVGSMLDHSNSASSPSDSRDSPLATLLGGFKSGSISSRSSIVKAISDNKLARTALSTVSKTLGGNKYVAGAAAASALAALGLTVSKFLGPYFSAGGYTKLGGDPMIGAGSYLSPSLAMPSILSTDRNFVFASPSSDSMLASGSSAPMLVRPASNPLSYPYSASEFTYDPATGAYEPVPVASGSGQSSGYFAPPPQTSEPVYLTYSPRLKSLSQDPSTASAKQLPIDSTNGHYTNFYSQQVDSPPASGPAYDQASASSMYPQPYSATSGQSGGPTSSHQEASFEGPPSFYTHSSSSGSGNPQNQHSSFEQLLPAASADSPSYASKPAPTGGGGGQSGPNARRVGAVSLRMDDATRARLFQHLLRQQQQQQPMRIAAAPLTGYAAGGDRPASERPGQIAGVFVPLSSSSPSAEVYATSNFAGQQQQQATKSGRMEQNNNNNGNANGDTSGGLYINQGAFSAPLDNGQQQQQQQHQVQGQSVGSNGPGYLILRPNSAERQQQQQGSWRSAATDEASGKQAAWQSMVAANKQIDDHQAGDFDQQASDSAPRSRVVSGDAGQPMQQQQQQVANGREEQVSMSALRVSRTPNQSSVTQEQLSGGSARRPAESLADYDGVKGGLSGGSGPINLEADQRQSSAAGGAKSAEPHRASQQQATGQRLELGAGSAQTSGDDSKTNLIQLNNDNDETMDNKNSVIKLIDVNTNSAIASTGANGKLAANSESQYDSGLLIMSPPAQTSSQRSHDAASDGLGGSADGGRSQQLASNHNQRWTPASPSLATGKSQLSSDFPEMATLTRSSFSDFSAGD